MNLTLFRCRFENAKLASARQFRTGNAMQALDPALSHVAGDTSQTGDAPCGNWTSAETGGAMVGHHNKQGGGAAPTSWNAAHSSKGCSQQNLVSTGGNGYFYCFAN